MKQRTPYPGVARSLSLLVSLILVLLPFHAFLTTWVGSRTGHMDLIRTWKEMLMLLMLPPSLWISWRNQHIKKWLLKSWLVRLIAIYALLHLVLGIWAYKHQEVNKTALIYALIINLRFFYFFCLCAVIAACDSFLRDNWAKIVLIPGAVVVFFGLLQKLILPNDFLKHFGYRANTIPAYQTVDANVDYTRIQSTMRGANPLGTYLIVLLPAFLLKLRQHMFLLAAAFAGILIVLFYTYSRSAVIGAGLALTSLGWLSMRRPTKRWLITGTVILLIIPGLYIGFRSNQTIQKIFLHTSNTSTSSASSNRVRDVAIHNAFLDVRQDPIGKGPGTAGPASFRNFGHGARIAECYYLQLGQEIGVFGLLLFIIINIMVARGLWFERKSPLPLILLASLIGLSFVNLVSHAWTDDTLSLLWWGLAGIAYAPIIGLKDNTWPKKPKTNASS